MKLIRKIGFFLLIICSLSVQTVIANEDVSDISDKAKVLQSMNIVEKSNKDADDTITRSELANSLAMMVNDALPKGFELADLTEADGGMYWLYNANVIVGNGDGLLRPTDEITLSEAVKMTLSVMGYDYAAETAGGYPNGYMKVARDCRILDDIRIPASDVLTYDNFIRMLYNVIDAEIMVYDMADKGYKPLHNETLLSYYRDIHKERGVISSNHMTGLYEESGKTAVGTITIGTNLYNAGEIYEYCSDLLGYNVEFWYDIDDHGELSLCYVRPYKTESKLVNAADVYGFENSRYKYEESNGKQKHADIDNSTVIIYNGISAAENIVYTPVNGSIEFIDNDGDSAYDVIKIRDIDYIVVDRVYENEDVFTIYDKFDSGRIIDIVTHEDEKYRVYNEDGEIKKLRDIMPGMAVSVEKNASSDGDYYKLTIHKNTVIEAIMGISEEEAETPEGKYKLTGRCNELILNEDIKINLGDVYKIYLTDDSRIIFLEQMTETELFAERIGYLEKITPIDELLGTEFIVKIYDQDGMWLKLRLATRVRIDDESKKAIKAAETIEQKLGGLIKFRMNIKGEVEEIYFPAPLPDGKTATKFDKRFQLLLDSTGAYYKYYSSSYTVGVETGPILQVSPNCKVFVKSVNTNAEDSIGVVLPRGFLSDGATKYDMEAYSITGKPGFADVLLVNMSNARVSSGERVAVVNKVSVGINEDGEVSPVVKLITNGVEKKYFIDDQRKHADTSTLPFGEGDVLTFARDLEGKYTLTDYTDGDGNVYNLGWKMLCDYEDGVIKPRTTSAQIGGGWTNTANTGNRVKYGRAYDVAGDSLIISNTDKADDWRQLEAVKCSAANVYVWDGKKFKLGSINDAILYKNDPTNASRVYMLNHNQYHVMVIYNGDVQCHDDYDGIE